MNRIFLALGLSLFAWNASAMPQRLPYCRTLVSGWNKAGDAFMAEAAVEDFKEYKHGDLTINQVSAINGGQHGISKNNIEVFAHVTDANREYQGFASGDAQGVISTGFRLDSSKEKSNVCFGAVEAVIMVCSFDQSKVNTYMDRFVKGPGYDHTLPDCP